MNSAKETAEAILLVIKVILQWIVIIAVVLVAGVFAIFQLIEAWEWYTIGRYEKKVEVNLKVALDNDCGKSYPYIYIIQNKSGKTVEETEFNIEIRKSGYSNTINSYTSLTDSKIIKPGESTISCFRAEKKNYTGDVMDKDVDLLVSYKKIKFQK